MKQRHFFTAAALAVAIMTGIGSFAPAQTPPQKADTSGAGELANRFEALAYMTPSIHKPLPGVNAQTAALLRAAARLNPKESRYWRFLFEVATASHDSDAAITALNGYLTIIPEDQVAQVKLINLYVARMQTVDSILSYLHGVVAKTQLAAPVRSAAAVVCAQTLLDHSQKAEALKMLDAALQIDPLNLEALRIKYALVHDEGAATRVGLLLAILRSNPLNPPAATQLGSELADLGLTQYAAIWYAQAANLYDSVGQSRDAVVAKGGAASLYLCDHPADAANVIKGYCDNVPIDADAWEIRLAIARDIGSDPALFDDQARQAVRGVTNLLQMVRGKAGAPNATTQPVTGAADGSAQNAAASAPKTDSLFSLAPAPTIAPAPDQTAAPAAPTAAGGIASADPPDMTGDMALLVKANNSQLTDQYIATVTELAWIRLYFLHDNGDGTQRLLAALGQLLPSQDVVLTRLTGWSYLVGGKYDEARQKLSAVADRDPYAALGMVMILDKAGDKAAADALARATMAAHPSGPVAAVLYGSLRARGAKVIPTGQAEAVRAALDGFPKDWLNIVSQPQSFYTLVAEPLQPTVEYGQAILARVTIANTGPYDLTLGDQGVIHPDLVFGANSRGLVEKQMPGALIDRFWQRLLLPKGQSASEIVRMDRGPVAKLLSDRPEIPMDFVFSVATNPVYAKDGYGLRPAGTSATFGIITERAATPINTLDDLKKLYARITDGPPGEHLNAIETAISFGASLRSAAGQGNTDQQLTTSKDMLNRARQGLGDADPSVRAWTQYMFAIATPPEQMADAAAKMLAAGDWPTRMLGLVVAQRLGDGGAAAAKQMADDADPEVKAYARSITDYFAADAAAATQPSATPGK
jgi:tetratricopeptide (TPR) repeat protein